MSIDLSELSITTIGYGEPTLWASIALASLLAVLAGQLVGRTIGRIRHPGRRRVLGASAGAAVTLLVVAVTIVILDALFSHYHRGMVCTAFVTPALLIPAVLALTVERVAWKRALLSHDGAVQQ